MKKMLVLAAMIAAVMVARAETSTDKIGSLEWNDSDTVGHVVTEMSNGSLCVELNADDEIVLDSIKAVNSNDMYPFVWWKGHRCMMVGVSYSTKKVTHIIMSRVIGGGVSCDAVDKSTKYGNRK